MRTNHYAMFAFLQVQSYLIAFLNERVSSHERYSDNFKSFIMGEKDFPEYVNDSSPTYLANELNNLLCEFNQSNKIFDYLAEKLGITHYAQFQGWVTYYYKVIGHLVNDSGKNDIPMDQINCFQVMDA